MKSKRELVLLLFAALLAACSPKQSEEQTEETVAVTDTSVTGRKITELTNSIAADPDDADLLHQRGVLYIQTQRFSKALPDIQRAIQLDSTKAAYYVSLSDIQMAANKPTQARMSLETSLRIEPENKEANMKLAELFFIAKQYNNVFTHLNAVLKADIHNPQAYMMKGMTYKEMRDTVNAISSFQTAIEQDPKYYAPFMQLGIIYSMKNSLLALQYFNGALNIKPNSEEALYGRAMWYQEHEKNYDQAIIDYTSIIQLNPRNKNAHFNLGYLHYEYLKVYSQAIKHYTDAINVDPQYAEAMYNRGLAYETSGDIRAAKADYESAIHIRPGYQLAMEGLERVK